MTSITRVLLILVLISHCKAEDGLFEGVAKIITTAVVENPIVQFGSEIIGNGLVRTADLLSRGPMVVARAAQEFGWEIPTLDNYLQINGFNNGLVKRFLKEFNAGSGNEDASLRIDKLISKYGYPVEEHKVNTKDGYILTMFRIPGDGPPVFLMHGLLASADDFVVGGPNGSLAYLLADKNYDVWMGNARGNKHSRSHKTLNPDQREFWDFTWHEIGVYDLPAMTDYVLKHNESGKKVKYIGHSQGTTAFFVFLSEKPEYNKKISQMVALSPVAFMGKVKSPLVRLLAPGGSLIYYVTTRIGVLEVLPDDEIVKFLKSLMCGNGVVSEIICNNIMFLITGFDFQLLNVRQLPVMLGHLPAGCSIKQLLHYGQGVLTGEFRKFDFGKQKNWDVYGSRRPPKYKLRKVTVPVTLFYSDEDWLAHPDDVNKLYRKLGNKDDNYNISFPGFNHLDFIFAKYFTELVFSKIELVLNENNDE